VAKFLEGIPLASERLPAISIYYPGHAKFEIYDVIVAAWDITWQRRLYGYQCKEGSTIPRAFANEDMFTKSFLVRDKAVASDSSVCRYFTTSDSHLDDFFGKLSRHWTPKAWKLLTATTAPAKGGTSGRNDDQ
jgi:hypothetical protein